MKNRVRTGRIEIVVVVVCVFDDEEEEEAKRASSEQTSSSKFGGKKFGILWRLKVATKVRSAQSCSARDIVLFVVVVFAV